MSDTEAAQTVGDTGATPSDGDNNSVPATGLECTTDVSDDVAQPDVSDTISQQDASADAEGGAEDDRGTPRQTEDADGEIAKNEEESATTSLIQESAPTEVPTDSPDPETQGALEEPEMGVPSSDVGEEPWDDDDPVASAQGAPEDGEYSISPRDAMMLLESDGIDDDAGTGDEGEGMYDDERDVIEVREEDMEWFQTTSFVAVEAIELPQGWQRVWVDDGKKLVFRDNTTGEIRDTPPNAPPAPTPTPTVTKSPTRSTILSPTREQFDADPAKWTLLESLTRAKFDLNKIDISRFQQPVTVEIQHPKQPLGISVKDSRNDTLLPGAVVTHIQPGSPASTHTDISVGDIILSLDGKSLVGLPFKQILAMLQRSAKGDKTTMNIVPAQKVFAHTVKNDDQQDLGLELDGNYIKGVREGSPAQRYGVPPAHYILSVADLSVASLSTEELQETLRGMYGEFTFLTMAKSVYEAQRLGRGITEQRSVGAVAATVGTRLRKASGTAFASMRKAIADQRTKVANKVATARAERAKSREAPATHTGGDGGDATVTSPTPRDTPSTDTGRSPPTNKPLPSNGGTEGVDSITDKECGTGEVEPAGGAQDDADQ